jgi:hypothetical protein
MFRCGWHAFVALSSSVLVLAFGQSCSSADGTTEGLFESERNPDGASGGRSSGGAGMALGGGSIGTGGRPTGGADVGAGGELADGGEAPERGGRATMGGRGSDGGRGGKAGGGGPGGGTANGGSAGEQGGGNTNSGGTPNEGGFGGRDPAVECDDDDPCTIDEPDTEGLCHFTPKCIARGMCEEASCDADTGECQFGAINEGDACDDQQACTTGDLCENGSCSGVSNDLVKSAADMRTIPDGAADCGGGQPVTLDFDLPEGGVVTAIEVGIEVYHPNLANLSASILHVQSNRQAVLFDRPDASGRGLGGRYLFASGGPSFADAAAATDPSEDVTPESYAGVGDLASVFDGDQVQGTWRLSVTDLCLEDIGEFVGAELRIVRACEQAQ